MSYSGSISPRAIIIQLHFEAVQSLHIGPRFGSGDLILKYSSRVGMQCAIRGQYSIQGKLLGQLH